MNKTAKTQVVVTINNNEPPIVAEFRALVDLLVSRGWDAGMLLPVQSKADDDTVQWLVEDCECGNKVWVETCSNEAAGQVLARLVGHDIK